jgi:hypothetical protein
MATSTPPDVGGQGLVGLGEAQEAVQEKAGEAKGAVVRAVSDRLDTASSQAGGQLIDISGALRQTGEQLRTEGKEQPAKVVEAISDRTDQLARYLSDKGSSEILDDLERLGRSRPCETVLSRTRLGHTFVIRGSRRAPKATSPAASRDLEYLPHAVVQFGRFRRLPLVRRPVGDSAACFLSRGGR